MGFGMKISAFALTVIIVLVLMNGCTNATAPAMSQLAVINQNMAQLDSGDLEFKVEVKNIGTVKADLAQITLRLYDGNGSLVDTLKDSVMNLKQGESWTFKIVRPPNPT